MSILLAWLKAQSAEGYDDGTRSRFIYIVTPITACRYYVDFGHAPAPAFDAPTLHISLADDATMTCKHAPRVGRWSPGIVDGRKSLHISRYIAHDAPPMMMPRFCRHFRAFRMPFTPSICDNFAIIRRFTHATSMQAAPIPTHKNSSSLFEGVVASLRRAGEERCRGRRNYYEVSPITYSFAHMYDANAPLSRCTWHVYQAQA